jgi:hypothetical protein
MLTLGLVLEALGKKNHFTILKIDLLVSCLGALMSRSLTFTQRIFFAWSFIE